MSDYPRPKKAKGGINVTSSHQHTLMLDLLVNHHHSSLQLKKRMVLRKQHWKSFQKVQEGLGPRDPGCRQRGRLTLPPRRLLATHWPSLCSMRRRSSPPPPTPSSSLLHPLQEQDPMVLRMKERHQEISNWANYYLGKTKSCPWCSGCYWWRLPGRFPSSIFSRRALSGLEGGPQPYAHHQLCHSLGVLLL